MSVFITNARIFDGDRPIQHMLQGTNRIHARTSRSGGTSRSIALTEPFPDEQTHRRSSGPSRTAGYVVPSAQAVLLPPPTPRRLATHFPRSPVIERHALATPIRRLPGRGGSHQFRRHYPNVPRPIRRGVLRRLHFQVFSVFPGLHRVLGGSALPALNPHGRDLSRRRRLRVMLRTAQLLPLEGHSTLGFDPAGFPTKPPLCYRAS
jgi:hypothetical protein